MEPELEPGLGGINGGEPPIPLPLAVVEAGRKASIHTTTIKP